VEGDESGQAFDKVSKSLGETLISSEPGEGALDHPATRQDDKAFAMSGSTRSTPS
jgi:hypothetical protein